MKIVFDDRTEYTIAETILYRALNVSYNGLSHMKQVEGSKFPVADKETLDVVMEVMSRIDLISMKRDMAGGNPSA